MKLCYFYKLIPPRPTFNIDMNENEKNVMSLHVEYWAKLFEERIPIVYGPVLDPTGVFGMAVIEVDSAEHAYTIAHNDPAVSSRINTFELIPMMLGMSR